MLLCLAVNTVQAQMNNTFYIHPNGNDTNPGTETSPWKTLNYALKEAPVAPGDNILIKPGRYTEKKVVIRNSGAPNDWINVIGLTENGQRPIFDGTDDTLPIKTNWKPVHDTVQDYGGSKAIYEYRYPIDNPIVKNNHITQFRGFY